MSINPLHPYRPATHSGRLIPSERFLQYAKYHDAKYEDAGLPPLSNVGPLGKGGLWPAIDKARAALAAAAEESK